jgi:DNA repair/transcription protein MET18/MMS19
VRVCLDDALVYFSANPLAADAHIASVSHYTVTHVVPHLIKLFLNPDEAPNRGPTLKLFASFIAALRDSNVKFRDVDASWLVPYKDEVLGIFTTGIKTSSSSGQAIEGLHALVTTPKLLDDEEVGFVVSNVNDVLSGDRDDLANVRYGLSNLQSTHCSCRIYTGATHWTS